LDEERKREVRVKGDAGSVLERALDKSEVVKVLDGRLLKKSRSEGVYPGVFSEEAANAGLISARVKKSEEE